MPNKNGDYFSVVLRANSKVRHCRIHVLVAEAFIGQKPSGYQVHHIDGNKQNNIVENLMYISTKEHYQETLKENPQIVSGMKNYNQNVRPRKILQYDLNGLFIAEYKNSKEAYDKTGVCARNILQVADKTEYKKGKTRKQAGGFVWKFAN